MSPTTLRMETTVLPGHRLEVSAPELPEGAQVEVTIVLAKVPARANGAAHEFFERLPSSPSPRCFPTWEEYERHVREEIESWDR